MFSCIRLASRPNIAKKILFIVFTGIPPMKLLHLLRRIIINGIYSSEIIRFLLFWYLRLCLIKPFTCYILSYGEIILPLPLWTESYHEAIQKIPYSIALTISQNFTKGNYSLLGRISHLISCMRKRSRHSYGNFVTL